MNLPKDCIFEGIVIERSGTYVKVFIPELHWNITDLESLPLCSVIKNPLVCGNSSNFGSVNYIPVFASVAVLVIGESMIVLGQIELSNNTNTVEFQADASDEFPSYGFIDRFNNIFKVNQQTGEVLLDHGSGTRIQIDINGNVNINSSGSINMSASSVNIKGNLVVEGDVSADGVGLKNHTHGGVQGGPSNTSGASGGGTSPSYTPPTLIARDPFDSSNSSYTSNVSSRLDLYLSTARLKSTIKGLDNL